MDDDKLAQLYEQYGYLVHRRCLALVRNAADAEDALQETFLRVKRLGASPSTDGSTLSWLYTIARNVSFDLRERRGREPVAGEDDLEAAERHGAGDPADADRRALVGAALRDLDPVTREIGVLHHLDGYTQEEVAERTGYSRKTIGKKLQRFEERVRELWSAGLERMTP
ncbi:MAG: sigma-70 family RNA polymerase sigma factor [Anaeromyxobacter sp.]